MRTPGRLVAGVAAGLAAAFLVAAPTGASAEAGYGVDAVSIEPGPYAVSGFRTAAAAISVTMHDVDGVRPFCTDGGTLNGHIEVQLTRAGAPASDRQRTVEVLLERTSGDAYAGTWTGAWRIGSTRSGTWVLTRVWWCVWDSALGEESGRWVDPRSSGLTASTVVVGTRAPVVTQRRVPAVVPWGGRQWLELSYRDAAGRTLAGRPTRFGIGEMVCGWFSFGTGSRPTDSRGRIYLRMYRSSLGTVERVCAYLTVPAGADPGRPATTVLRTDDGTGRYERYARVSLTTPPALVRAGVMASLRGSVTPTRARVSVQRFVAGRWRPVASGLARAAGRYDIAIVVPRGTWRWRVVALAPAAGLAPTASRVVVITGR